MSGELIKKLQEICDNCEDKQKCESIMPFNSRLMTYGCGMWNDLDVDSLREEIRKRLTLFKVIDDMLNEDEKEGI